MKHLIKSIMLIVFIVFLFGCNTSQSNESSNHDPDNVLDSNINASSDVTKEFNASLDFSENINSNYNLSVTGKTNLPDGTELLVVLENNSGYQVNGGAKVLNGYFESGTFSNKGLFLDEGEYTLTVQTLKNQSSSVSEVIGENGKLLIGENIKETSSGNVVSKSKSINIFIPEDELEMNENKKKVMLAVGYQEEDYKPLVEDNTEATVVSDKSPEENFSEPSNEDKAFAWTAAIKIVKENLKAPSTAKFPSRYNDQDIRKVGTDTFVVNSYVDAENSFGASIRSNFSVRIKKTGDESFIVESVEIN